jgi:steroid 5-alpha reductase family enzyme
MLIVLIIETIIIAIYMTVWFFIAQIKRRNDVADIAWGTGFIIIAITALLVTDRITSRGLLSFFLVMLWGLRLATHIYMRNRRKSEDPRYRKWKEEWGKHAVLRAFLQVFLFQGFLIVIISLPVTFIIMSGEIPVGIFDLLGVGIWLMGFIFEAVGDYQLLQYKRDSSHKGKIMNQGLWTYTRHPNYFGEVTLWWGMYLIALSVQQGWMTVLGPLTITFLILKVSGIPLLEDKYKDNPEFQKYKRRTSAFFPLPPRKEV